MNEPTMETLARRLDRVERENRRLKQAGVVALTVIAAVVLMGQATASKAAEAENRTELATVQRDGVPMYAQMMTTSEVLAVLQRQAVVTIHFAVTGAEGTWCYVTKASGRKRSGYVRCEDLERDWPPAAAPPTVAGRPKEEVPPVAAIPPEAPPKSPRPTETLAQGEKPTPTPLTKVAKPRVKPKREYSIQVASLVRKKNALSLKERLEKLGYSPSIRRTTARITRHRVFAGEFSSREEAEQTARRMNVDEFPSNLVESESGEFRLEVGSFFQLNKAIDLAHDLQKKTYTPKIVSEAAPTPVHQVRVGEYQTRAEALKAREALKRQGVAPLVVRQ